MGIARPLIPPTAHRAEAASGAIMTALSQSMEFSVRDTCGNFFLIFRGNRSKAFRLHGWNSRAGSVVAGSTLPAAQRMTTSTASWSCVARSHWPAGHHRELSLPASIFRLPRVGRGPYQRPGGKRAGPADSSLPGRLLVTTASETNCCPMSGRWPLSALTGGIGMPSACSLPPALIIRRCMSALPRCTARATTLSCSMPPASRWR